MSACCPCPKCGEACAHAEGRYKPAVPEDGTDGACGACGFLALAKAPAPPDPIQKMLVLFAVLGVALLLAFGAACVVGRQP